MDIDEKIAAAKVLIAQREAIDQQLGLLFGGLPLATTSIVDVMKEAIQRKGVTCKNCGQRGHNTRSCNAPPRSETLAASAEAPKEYEFKVN